MREFKFRAWDSYHEEMIDWEQYKDELVVNDFKEHGKGPLVIMQYTGLKDKNGTDIYEGDYIEMPDSNYIWTVGFINNGFKVRALIEKSYRGGKYKEPVTFELINTDDARWGVEVIGNIYENPELIEEEE